MHKIFQATSVALLTLLANGCAIREVQGDGVTTFVYGSYEFLVPSTKLVDAKVFKAEDVAIKFSDGGLLAPILITHMSEQLPETFELLTLPEVYLLGEKPDGLGQEASQSLQNSSSALLSEYKGSPIKRWTQNSVEALYTCSLQNCITFIESRNHPDQIVMVVSNNLEPKAIKNFIKER